MARAKQDTPPKRIVKSLGRLGGNNAWLDRLLIDWGDGKPCESHIAGMPDGVFAIPILENGNVLIVHQYRLFNGGWRYEIPGGGVEQGESEEAAALREVEEETGYLPRTLRKLCTYRTDPMLQMTTSLYAATGLVKTKRKLDAGEKGLTAHEVTQTQLYCMVLDGTISDARSMLAVLIAKEVGVLKVKKSQLKKGHPF